MKIINNILATLLIAAGATLAAAPAMATENFISNGGFCVTCQLDGWAVNTSQGTFLRVGNTGHNEGFLYVKDQPASINQTFWDTAGPLTLSFDYRVEQTNPKQGLIVQYNDEVVFSSSTASASWVHQQIALTGHGRDNLRFVFNTFGVGASTAINLDNISVTAAVPEPETYGMLCAGLALMGVVARRRKA